MESANGGGDAMSGTVVHLLTETDSFSDVHGAALQRWVANVLRFEEEAAIVCVRARRLQLGIGSGKADAAPGAYGLTAS